MEPSGGGRASLRASAVSPAFPAHPSSLSYIIASSRIRSFWTTLSLGHREDCFCRRAVGVSLPDGILRRLALFV